MSRCDRVVALSPADARRLGRFGRRDKIRVVPTGDDLSHFAFAGPEGRDPDGLLFVGHYPHYPNEDAAVFLGREIMPALRAMNPRARLSLVGSYPTPAVQALASEAVEVVGTVPDVRPHLARAAVFIAPVRLGCGIKGKVLEAFASGTPVVATPAACEALPGVRDGEHLLIGRGAAALASQAARLLADAGLRRRLAEPARRYVEKLFGWERQAAALDEVYREGLGRPRAG
jgi:glycosyltransferase involved in cell wall biosynthesis